MCVYHIISSDINARSNQFLVQNVGRRKVSSSLLRACWGYYMNMIFSLKGETSFVD